MFEGVCGNSFTGDIALDDITFTVGAGSCPLQPNDGEYIEFCLFFFVGEHMLSAMHAFHTR